MRYKETEMGKIPIEWELRPLNQIIKIQNGYAFKSKNFGEEGNPVIKIKNVNGRGVDLSNCQLYPIELCEGLDKFKIYNNDILIAMTGAGSVGRVSKVVIKNSNNIYYLNQRVGKMIPDNDKLNNEFLYQIISSEKYESILFDLASGSGQPNLSPDTIGLVKIPYPSIQEQKAIAHILSTLDDKIETNNQINKTLEKMAQTIFKHWFVDFEFPNENGEPYKSSGGEMVESELGMIPKGWRGGKFREYIDTILGGDWGKENSQGNYNKEIYCLRGADIPEVRMGKRGKLPSRYIIEKNHINKKLSSGNLVIEISGGSPTQSTGRITYIAESMLRKYDKDLVCTNFCRAATLKSKYSMEYLYYYWNYLYNLGTFFQYENGTTGIKNFDINTFIDTFNIAKPDEELILKFHNLVKVLLKNIQFNGEENEKLEKMRDSLLPKLMSGEIRVPLEEGVI